MAYTGLPYFVILEILRTFVVTAAVRTSCRLSAILIGSVSHLGSENALALQTTINQMNSIKPQMYDLRGFPYMGRITMKAGLFLEFSYRLSIFVTLIGCRVQ